MWHFTEVADWFERNRNQSGAILDQWVEDSQYNTGVMIAASTTKAFMTIGAGFVDILRLGDGVSEGTLKGAGEDALRVVAIFPVGKATQTLKSAKGLAAAKIIADIKGPHCFWVASVKALQHVSHKYKGQLFVSVDDLAKALKMPASSPWVIPNLSTGMSYLRQLGAKTGPVIKVSNSDDIVKIIPRDGSVVMIAVRLIKKGIRVRGHAIYAFRTPLGQVRYMDRTVGKTFNSVQQGVYKSIDDMVDWYEADTIIPFEAAVLHNVFTKTVAHDLPPVLAIPVLGVMAEEN